MTKAEELERARLDGELAALRALRSSPVTSTPPKNGHDSQWAKYGLPIIAALVGIGGGTIGGSERASGLVDWRMTQAEKRIEALHAEYERRLTAIEVLRSSDREKLIEVVGKEASLREEVRRNYGESTAQLTKLTEKAGEAVARIKAAQP